MYATKMKILLIIPSFESSAIQEGASYPLGVLYLASILEKEGHKCIVRDYLFEDWSVVEPKIEKMIKESKFDVVGISMMTTNRIASLKLITLIKKINKKIIIILGGIHATLMYKQVLQNCRVDFITLGESEETIKELVWALNEEPKLWKKFKNMKNSPFIKIKGIAFKNKSGIIKTAPRPPIQDLDSIPFPKHIYFKSRIKKSKTIFMITSRGCPVGCTFCSTCNFWGKLRRQRSPENVIQEVKYLKKRFLDLEKVYFNDDEFVINREWCFKFCELIEKEKISWECAARVSSISEELISKMKEAGCKRIGFGVESGSPKILNSIRKRITREQTINAFKLCEKYGIEAAMFLMVGLPGETEETINETISLLKETRNADFRIPSLFQVLPGNEIYEQAKKQGFINDDYWLTDKLAPFYTFENSKTKLLYWAVKIAFFNKYYKGELMKFIFSNLKSQLKPDKIKRIIKTYLK